jgi:CO/xanthine dehydrogenase Mo-binding subunit/aerobic-type carbon monoxide dehydrogenase small subunit (CoxS/CutS family)
MAATLSPGCRARAHDGASEFHFRLNGEGVSVAALPTQRLSKVLRENLGLTGTKVGCDAGDCGACTILLGGAPVCACLVPVAQADGCEVITIEGAAARGPLLGGVQDAFLRHGAAQCGACTPGMVMAVTALLERNASPNENEVMDAIGGVLCRCTGYRKIVQAALDVRGRGGDHDGTSGVAQIAAPAAGEAIGKRLVRLDGKQKVSGAEIFGADYAPAGSLGARVIRSPFDHARFQFGDIDAFVRTHSGITRVFTAKDIPGKNCFGVIPMYADQPVFAENAARFRGEAVACVVGEPEVLEALDLKSFPVTWEELPALKSIDAAAVEAAPLIHSHRPGNVLVRGRVACGDVTAALAEAQFEAAGEFESGFVEHAYIEPEAGFARRVGDTIEVQASTQAPYMDRADLAAILALASEAVRVIPTAVGGGFGSKLDLSMQPFVALAAWHLRRPVRMVYSRTESMMSTTKRHPSRIRARVAADRDGRLTAMDFSADFNTGAYSSWGPTVAARVPIHASGPYRIPNYRAQTRAVHTNLVPAGAFRGFGVPQAAIAQEQLFDELANRLGMDRLEFRILNALDASTPTVTGQVLGDGVGIRACFEALRPRWLAADQEAKNYNRGNAGGPHRRGIGVAGVWYGCGNTSLPNPSTVRVGLKADGRISLHQGAVDIGQGSATVIPQICADALGAPIDRFDFISGDTALSPDCGKTSASRQTFVSGKAASMAGINLRRAILQLGGECECARFTLGDACVVIEDGEKRRCISLRQLPLDANGYVATGEATFDPPTQKLDENGQGIPYAVYGFGAQMAEVSVDMDLGTVKVLRITAAHDVGRAINPTLVEGQIEGGIAQGLGMALMEEFFPGRGENLHDYLIPTVGDIPPIESILIEDPSSVGPSGAKGIGEHSMVATGPAILNAIYDAAGVRIRKVPATPARVRAAIVAAAAAKSKPG